MPRFPPGSGIQKSILLAREGIGPSSGGSVTRSQRNTVQAIALDPNNHDAHANLGYAWQQWGKRRRPNCVPARRAQSAPITRSCTTISASSIRIKTSLPKQKEHSEKPSDWFRISHFTTAVSAGCSKVSGRWPKPKPPSAKLFPSNPKRPSFIAVWARF